MELSSYLLMGRVEKQVKNMNGSIYTTDDIKKIIEPIAKEYGVKKLSVFGSYARGEATEKSDIDFHLIDTEDQWGYFKFYEFLHELEDTLGIKVDIITTEIINSKYFQEARYDEVIILGQ